MTYTDFADQYSKNKGHQMRSNHISRLLMMISFTATLSLLLFLIPSQKELRLYEHISPPSSYQATLTEYLNILEQHNDPSIFPSFYENDLKRVAINALNLSSESKVYYPQHQRLSELSIELEQEIGKKFPELIARK